MLGTILSILTAIVLYFYEIKVEIHPNNIMAGIIFIVTASLIVLIHPLILTLSLSPLQIAERHMTPHIFDLYVKDRRLFFSRLWLILFPLVSYAFAIDVLAFNIVTANILLPLWIILFGISLDVLYYSIKRLFGYLDPFYVVNLFSNEANIAIQNEHELNLYHWIDGLSEIGVKAIERTSPTLCNEVCNELNTLTRLFLESSKSVSHHAQDSDTKKLGISDKVSYTLFYVLQRLDMINERGVQQRIEPVCSSVIAALGKIIVSAAQYDITMMDYPLHYFGRAVKEAQSKGLHEVANKAVCTLVEVAKAVLTDIDLSYLEIKQPFFILISQLEMITKEMFRQDKTINIKLLRQPFVDLKELFKKEKIAKHQDTPVIVQNLDRIIAEFDALETVMLTKKVTE